MWGFVEKCSCVKIWRRVLTLPVAILSMRSLDSATVLYSNSYYTVVASIFLVSAASCTAICEVTSVRTSDYSQPFWLKWHALLMPHMLIKYAHVLICISAGEGSRHFSVFHYNHKFVVKEFIICVQLYLIWYWLIWAIKLHAYCSTVKSTVKPWLSEQLGTIDTLRHKSFGSMVRVAGWWAEPENSSSNPPDNSSFLFFFQIIKVQITEVPL